MSRALATFFLGLFVVTFDSACSSAPKNEHVVQRLIPPTLRVRRPEGPGADPKAGPGGIDYTSKPLPNERLDCERVEWLFRELDLEAVRACLNGVKDLTLINYRLRRDVRPYLELEDPEKAPECLPKVLSKIPVPREIFYQSPSPEQEPDMPRYLCYAARLAVEADEVLGTKLPRHVITVQMALPLDPAPKDRAEVIRALTGYVLTPLLEEDKGGYWKSKIVTDSLCQKCLGEREMLKTGQPAPLYWP